MTLNTYEIWSQGYRITGNEGKAYLVTTHEGETFRRACIDAHKAGKFEGHGDFDPFALTLWSCRLFDNEADARKAFG